MNIKESNKLIAEFMEWKWEDSSEMEFVLDDHDLPDSFIPELVDRELIKLKFNSSWDWLMPVYIKCTKLAKQYNSFQEGYPGLGECNMSDISQYYNVVVEFIKWYNKNKNL